ncbi:MAG TPA: sulfite exporter TauE/SafE family protein [Terriglobales bacterium]|nr:sulfite exporter TauE/SafE family protein [Terriglobales bacterium]
MDLKVSLLGFIVGFLVGVTGTGGGALLTPLLIVLGWAPPMMAVGTDLVWSTITKAAGALVHWRQQTVDFTIVKRLALGSIPGALVGLALLAHLNTGGADRSDRLVLRMLGVALVAVALSMFWRCFRKPHQAAAGRPEKNVRRLAWLTTLAGLIVGFLVSLTSVGSGSLIIASLVILYRDTPLRRIVGSDIVHALLLVGVAAVGHMGIGSINLSLLKSLLIGSIPGVWLGSRMTARVPEKALRPVLGTTLLLLGYKLL